MRIPPGFWSHGRGDDAAAGVVWLIRECPEITRNPRIIRIAELLRRAVLWDLIPSILVCIFHWIAPRGSVWAKPIPVFRIHLLLGIADN
jgi:hypothetical protein